MSLLSIANYLHDGVVQQWFHSDPRVQATELLLHEKPVAHVRATRGYGAAPHESSPGGWIPVTIELFQRLISIC